MVQADCWGPCPQDPLELPPLLHRRLTAAWPPRPPCLEDAVHTPLEISLTTTVPPEHLGGAPGPSAWAEKDVPALCPKCTLAHPTVHAVCSVPGSPPAGVLQEG